MGEFIYGMPTITAKFDDRLLAHLKVVIVSKLRRNESFTFSWDDASGEEVEHFSVWLHPAIPLQWVIAGNEESTLNRAWLEELVRSANTVAGLKIVPEPQDSHPVEVAS
jgi:hypothetical protein